MLQPKLQQQYLIILHDGSKQIERYSSSPMSHRMSYREMKYTIQFITINISSVKRGDL